MSCTISNKFSHPINYLSSTCFTKKELVGKEQGEEPGKTKAAGNSRGGWWPSARQGETGCGGERPWECEGGALEGFSVGPW